MIDARWAPPALVASFAAGFVLTTWLSTAAVVRCLEHALGALGPGSRSPPARRWSG